MRQFRDYSGESMSSCEGRSVLDSLRAGLFSDVQIAQLCGASILEAFVTCRVMCQHE